MLWIILAAIYAATTAASFVAFWREDASWGRRPDFIPVLADALLWWLNWPMSLARDIARHWRCRRDGRATRRFGKG